MYQKINILLPLLPSNSKEIYFKGYFLCTSKQIITIYVTEYTTNNELREENMYTARNAIYGHFGTLSKKHKYNSDLKNYLILHQNEHLEIKMLIINNKPIQMLSNRTIILYDYNKLANSECICESPDIFSKLQVLIQQHSLPQFQNLQEPLCKKSYWVSRSTFGQHLVNYINLIYWLVKSIKRDKKVSIKQGNLILAIVIDIILGYCLLELLRQDTTDLSSTLMGVLEKLVNSLYSLLKWLMGAPAGLKLNNAFNKMLGKYFSYHIQLWWLFLDVAGTKLDIILQMYYYLGYLGFTFHAAIISDMICIATFHSYCIYVYAARLFNIQVSGLIALLRLFVGRKYNPLRGGIDSCQYTNQELFVGTVAFTILLLLLPTTALYYIVFTLFRLLSLTVQHALAKLIYFIQTLPLYVVILWSTKSSKIAGNLLIEVIDNTDALPTILKVKLFPKPVSDLIHGFKPPVEMPERFQWTNLLSNIFIGKQIV